MRGIIFILVLGLLFFGCIQQDYTSAGNVTNVSDGGNGSTVCTGPVCGADEKTYATDCEADKADVDVEYTGACVPKPSCSDSDGGINVKVAGSASNEEQTGSDFCLNSKVLAEFLCINDSVISANMSCAESERCNAGACVEYVPEQETPASTECMGPSEPDTSVKETVTLAGMNYSDICIDYKVVKDFYCKNNTVESLNNECEPGYGCNGGICTKLAYLCSETDAGNDTTMKGRTTVSRLFFKDQPMTDECIDEGLLTEYYCLENGTVMSEEIPCGSSKRCYEGKCTRSDCYDTDGGMDPYIQGEAHVAPEDGVKYEDNCVDIKKLQEYYCYGNAVHSESIYCEEGYTCSHDICTPGDS